ncbi:MAG: CatB-related O-acetyltransferase, partial [Pseudomonadota bacterium]
SSLGERVRIQRDNYIQDTRLGSYSYTGQSTRVFAADIGRFCSISWNVSIGPSEHKLETLTTHPLNHDESWGVFAEADLPVAKFAGTTTVGHDVWIGCGAFLRKGVRIADGCVIGANSVVLHDTEPYGIYAGSPARLIKKRFAEETIVQLMDINLYQRSDADILDIMKLCRGQDVDTVLIQSLAAL